MSDLYGDAFKDDKREERLFGVDISENISSYNCAEMTDIPESKSNNVSFMKVEDLSRDCRNILAVSDSYICYSVTQKKNLLRVIDTQLGEKVILRGHEYFVCDLSFSVANAKLMCSVDNGAGNDSANEVAGKPHTIVWSKSEQEGDWKVFAELPLRATLVRPHPQQAHTWLIARGSRLGVFSSQRSAGAAAAPVMSYEALPIYAVLDSSESVVDACFSCCGNFVAVAVAKEGDGIATSFLRVYRAAAGAPLSAVGGEVRVAGLAALRWISSNHIVTAAFGAPADATVNYALAVWHFAGAEAVASIQTVTVQLPRYPQGQSSTSLRNPLLEASLSAEPSTTQPRYLLLSSRRSGYVACLAVRPSASQVGQPLYHLTCLNLRAPVVSVGVTTVLGQAHHSAEAGEHLEVSCYQETASEPGQASIQQYHVLFAQTFDFAAYCSLPQLRAQAQARLAQPTVAPAAGNGKESDGVNKGKTILHMLSNLGNRSGALNSGGSSPAPSTSATASTATPAPIQAAALTTPGIVRPAPAAATSGEAILDALRKPSSLPTTPSASTPTGPAAATTGLPDFLLQTPTPAAGASILSVLKAAASNKGSAGSAGPAAAPSPVAAASVRSPLPAAATAAPALASASPSPSTPIVTKAAEPPRTAPSTAPSAASTPAVSAAQSAAGVIAPTASAKPAPAAPAAGAPAPRSQPAHTDASVVSLVKELQASIAAAHMAQQEQALQSLQLHQQQATRQLQQSAKDLQAAHAKHTEGLVATVKKAVEAEARRVLDQNTASAGTFKVEMSEQIMKELVPNVSAKVRDSVRDTVRDAVKAQLPGAVRESFEGALLPAFEAAAAAMFQQLQSAFVQGMQGVMAESLRVQQGAAAHSAKLEQEVSELRGTVARLEATVAGLAELLQGAIGAGGGLAAGAGAAAAAPSPEPAEDAFTLLKKGRISDAVVRVLEDKDIAVTVALLDQLTPAQVTSACSPLERLCITQQLAADLSVNIPIEGIGKRVDWIKCLVLSLLSGTASSEDPSSSYQQHFGAMIGAVLASITAAKQLIYSAQYDTGEDDGLSALQIPQSVGTDLHLLEFVIQSRMK